MKCSLHGGKYSNKQCGFFSVLVLWGRDLFLRAVENVMLLVENCEFDFIVGVITFYIVEDYFTGDALVLYAREN